MSVFPVIFDVGHIVINISLATRTGVAPDRAYFILLFSLSVGINGARGERIKPACRCRCGKPVINR